MITTWIGIIPPISVLKCTVATSALLTVVCPPPKTDRCKGSVPSGTRSRWFASSSVMKERWAPSSNRMCAVAALFRDCTVAIAVFSKVHRWEDLLSDRLVWRFATDVVAVLLPDVCPLMLVVWATLPLLVHIHCRFPSLSLMFCRVVGSGFCRSGYSLLTTQRLVWCFWWHCRQRFLDLHCDTRRLLRQLKHKFAWNAICFRAAGSLTAVQSFGLWEPLQKIHGFVLEGWGGVLNFELLKFPPGFLYLLVFVSKLDTEGTVSCERLKWLSLFVSSLASSIRISFEIALRNCSKLKSVLPCSRMRLCFTVAGSLLKITGTRRSP